MKPDTTNPDTFAPSGLSQGASERDKYGSQQGNQEPDIDREELRFDCVPPKKTVTVSVRYRISGRGRPLPYPLDEEDEK